jgi:hypothetical protein
VTYATLDAIRASRHDGNTTTTEETDMEYIAPSKTRSYEAANVVVADYEGFEEGVLDIEDLVAYYHGA